MFKSATAAKKLDENDYVIYTMTKIEKCLT